MSAGTLSLRDLLGEALRGLVRYPLRTSLALLGLVVGVASVVGTLGLVGAARDLSLRSLAREGRLDVLRIRSPEAIFERGRRRVVTRRARFVPADVPRVRSLVPEAAAAMVSVTGGGKVRAGAASVDADVIAGGPETPRFLPMEPVAGRFHSRAEGEGAARVVVLSVALAEDLFGASEPIGGEVVVAGERLTVIGVVDPPPGGDGRAARAAYLPFRTALERLGTPAEDAELLVAARDVDRLASLEARVREILPTLRAGMSAEDYDVDSPLEDLGEIVAETKMQATILGGVALLAMLAGGSGILNTLLVGVRERTREIGTRRALGARRGAILRQFLAEAVLLAVPGALAGLLAGAGVARFLGATFAKGLDDPSMLRVELGPREAAAAAAGALVVAGIAGVWPAVVAARVPPAEALRHE